MKNIYFKYYPIPIISISLFLSTGCQTTNQPTKQTTIQQDKTAAQPKSNTNKIVRKIISNVNTNSEDPLDDAASVYEGNDNIAEGVYIYQKLVFVVAVVDLNKKHQIEPEGVAMLREKRLLQNKFKLPETFSINRSVIQNEENDDGTYYRYVTVYRKSDILHLTGK